MSGLHAGPEDQALIDGALALGADAAVIVPAALIRVEEHFPDLCKPPGCGNYGLSANCPPHVMEPAVFREKLGRYGRALVFRIDAPMEILLAEERADVTRLLQETTAALERMASGAGYDRPWGIAGGCCKQLFCRDHETCSVLAGGVCRNPDKARMSLSGLGVDFNALSGSLGWGPPATPGSNASPAEPLGMLVGMVLLG